MLRTALKPRWIGFLILTMVVASVFVVLTQWQFEQSVASQPRSLEVTETPVELTDHFQPATPMGTDQQGQIVTFTGKIDPERTVQVAQRIEEGETGLWLVSSATVEGAPEGYSIPVVWGWIEEEIEAQPDEIAQLFEESTGVSPDETMEFEGRLLPGEGPTPNTNRFIEPIRTQMLATAQLVNVWDQNLYAGFVVAETFTVAGTEHTAAGGTGVQPVAVAPEPEDTDIAWLNIFYAIEWLLFGIFALYLWWRFVRDDYLKDQREAELDTLWEKHWRTQELERLREVARKDKVAAEQAYRAYYGQDSETRKTDNTP